MISAKEMMQPYCIQLPASHLFWFGAGSQYVPTLRYMISWEVFHSTCAFALRPVSASNAVGLKRPHKTQHSRTLETITQFRIYVIVSCSNYVRFDSYICMKWCNVLGFAGLFVLQKQRQERLAVVVRVRRQPGNVDQRG